MSNKRPNLNIIAEMAGVSRTAVSQVLCGSAEGKISVGREKADEILKIATELDYIPKESPTETDHKKKQYATIGFIVDYVDSTKLGSEALTAIQQALSLHGYVSLVAYTDFNKDEHEKAANELINRGVDGIICLSADMPENAPGYGELSQKNIPIICFAPHDKSCPLPAIELDYQNGAMMATRHLLEKGRQRILLMLPDLKWISNVKRRQGFLNACEIAGLSNEDSLVFIDPSVCDTNYSYRMSDVIYEITTWQVDAIITYNDLTAMALIQELEQQEIRVPEDISVVSLMDTPAEVVFHPQITAINYQLEQLIDLTINQLLNMVKTSGASHALAILPPVLNVRGSS